MKRSLEESDTLNSMPPGARERALNQPLAPAGPHEDGRLLALLSHSELSLHLLRGIPLLKAPRRRRRSRCRLPRYRATRRVRRARRRWWTLDRRTGLVELLFD